MEARGYRSQASIPLREDLAILLVRHRIDRADDPYEQATFDALPMEIQEAVIRLVARHSVPSEVVLAVGFTDATEMLNTPFGIEAQLLICRNCGRDVWGKPGATTCHICRRNPRSWSEGGGS